MKKMMIFLLIISILSISGFAYEISFFSAEEFLSEDNSLWFWQIYAEKDEVYVDLDMLHAGRRYLSGEAVNELPSKTEQVFYGVKAFALPYAAQVLITPFSSVVLGDTEVKFKILKNDITIVDWCGADEINTAQDIVFNAEKGDVIRFITAPVSEKPTDNIEIKWSPSVRLKSKNQFVQNACIKDGELSLDIVNFSDSKAEFYLVVALYDGYILKDIVYLEKAELSTKKQTGINIPVEEEFTSVKIFSVESMTDFKPYDKTVALENE